MEHEEITQGLSDELLSIVAGGMTSKEEQELRSDLKMMKGHGTPLEFVMSLIDNASTEKARQEYRDFTLKYWDQI